MRGNYLKAVLRQDLSYFDLDSTATSDVITSISNDTLIIQDTISEKVPDFISKISTFVAGYVVALILTWQLALASLPFAFLLVIPAWLCGRSLMDLSAEIRREYRKAGSIAEMTISSIRTVYAFVGEEKSVEQFSSALEWSMGLRLKQGLVKGLTIGSSSASIFAMWSFLCYYGSRLVVHGGARGGTIYAAGISITRGGLALGDSLSNLKDIAEACCVGERVMNVINLVPEIDSEDTEGLILEDVLGRVEFKQVHFSYPSRPESVVFDNFSLTVEPRKTVALVGASGSGKSTALALLQRFYNPINGEILLDGVSIDKFQLKWLRSHMALVSQEPSLFSTTVKENILFGKEDADMDDILEASVASDAHSFVSQLPHGYDTQVGERGIQLSGGQKQRIAIARAIIRKPRILLLDEATSALDSESERFFQEAIDKVASGRTTIIVAHRLSSIKNADAVAVMEHGRVKEIGSHEELMQDQTGVYFSLVRLQTMETKECKAPSYSKDRLENTGDDNSTLVERQETCLGDPDVPTVSFRRLLSLNKREWKQGTVGCLNAIIFGAIQPLFGVAMGATVMLFFSTDDSEIKDKVKDFALCFFGLSICSLLISVGQHYYFACMGENLTMRIREMMFSKILTFEVEWFDQDQNSSSILCSRLAKDANVVRSLVGDRISLVVQAISAVMIAWTIGLVISWRLAIVSIAIQPLIIVCFYTRRVLLKNMTRKGIKEQQESTKIAAEAVSNIRTVTTFSSQERILKLLDKAQEGPRKEIVRQSWFSGIVLGCSSSIMIANWCLNYWYGGKLVSKGYVSPREVFQTVTVLVTTGRIIAQAGTMTTILARGWDSIRSVFAILDKETKIKPEKSQSYQPENILGHVELCDISFAYPSRPNSMIFEGFSINVEAGKSLALVGKSGSGKSTVIGLIERFYDPIKGAVRIDGRDTRTYHLRSLRKYIALVNQEPTLFAGTIRENITYGSSNEVSETEIVEAARASNAHDFIARQKDGYNTLCGDRGLQLSGGQKQRIAIARAVLRNPAILLLDEATSALDSHSEKVVQEALERLMMTRSTSIVVAHRLCTIQNCDEIVVLDKGRVVEKGTHSSLMAMGPTGAYHSLAILQSNHSTY